jgi:V/A-type H+-transporting ATPase subunit E
MAEQIKTESTSVQALIDRIREQGVQSANIEAARILAEAEAKAAQLLAEAQKQAEQMRAKASAEIEAERSAAEEALKLSARDTITRLKNIVTAAFQTFVGRLVTRATQDQELMKNLILVLAGHSAEEFIKDKDIQILLSEAILTGPSDPKLLELGKQTILSLSSDMLREGVELIPSGNVEGGAKVRLVGEQLEIDLSDKAIAKMLAAHLLPRFQSILSGAE